MTHISHEFPAEPREPKIGAVKYASFTSSGTGDTTVVAAVAGKRIRVLGVFWGNLTAASTIEWRDGAGGTILMPEIRPNTGTWALLPYSPVGWFETSVNTALIAEGNTAANQSNGVVIYVEVSDN